MAMTPYYKNYNLDSVEKEMEKLAIRADSIIGQLQVYGIKIIINNDCIGDFHNIEIYRYINKTSFFLKTDYYILKLEESYIMRLPSDGKRLLEKLERALTKYGQ
jgi:hypothetical protein